MKRPLIHIKSHLNSSESAEHDAAPNTPDLNSSNLRLKPCAAQGNSFSAAPGGTGSIQSAGGPSGSSYRHQPKGRSSSGHDDSRTTTRVLVLDDHPLVRLGYRSLIGNEPDLEVVDETGSAQEALASTSKRKPDLVIVDISLPGMNGIEFIKQLQQRCPDILTLVVSMHDEELYAHRALRAGANGFLMKTEVGANIITAIRQVLSGDVYLSADMKRRVLHRYIGRSFEEIASPLEALGDRELEVFEHIGRGLSSREIAHRMHISPKTVDTYRGRIKSKLGIESGSELVQKAVLWIQDTKSPP